MKKVCKNGKLIRNYDQLISKFSEQEIIPFQSLSLIRGGDGGDDGGGIIIIIPPPPTTV